MRGPRPALLAALLLLCGCGGASTVPIATSPAQRVGPPAARPEAGAATREKPAPGRETIARGDEGITDEDLGDGGGPPDRADEPEGTKASENASGRGEPSAAEERADDAVYHILRHGQTLYSVARMYGVRLDALLDANGITDPSHVPADTPILIPGFRRSQAGRLEPEGAAEHLAWPLHGAITGAFGPRGKHSHHAGIDIDGEGGDPILAAASGTVIKAGTDGRYGRRVVVDHGDGLCTLYAHASRLLVQEGEEVRVGQEIAEVGHSGNARGTHLHFEVRRDGRAVNPLPYLKGGDLQASLAGAGGSHAAASHGTAAKSASHDVSTKSASTKSASAKSASTRPASGKPAAKPATPKPAAAKPTAAKPATPPSPAPAEDPASN